jgi:23S rRNA pseudouridine1911/1915/1917 synthase
VIAAAVPSLSRARVQRLLEQGAVLLNGAPARKSGRVVPGDRIQVSPPARAPLTATASAPALPVLYEDEVYVVIDKPPGLVVHGASADTAPSVASWFVATYPISAAQFDAERPGIVHRLDKDTSGVLLLAKDPASQSFAGRAFEARDTVKEYLAVTGGVPARAEAVIDAPIGRHPSDRTRMAIVRRGREARTSYAVLAAGKTRAFLRLRLYTGRTHQARVHLAAIDAPVSGDSVYGSAAPHRQLLHAWRLSVPHPGGRTLEVTSPLPDDMAAEVRGMGFEALASQYSAPVPARLRDGAPGSEA